MATPTLIVGLGNPGPEYEGTRHNVGFDVVDAVLAGLKSSVQVQHRFNGIVAATRTRGRQLHFVKPLTFMNNSGETVAKATRVLGVPPEEVLVLYDCMDLPLGRVRFRRRGSSGGHRGVESIISEMGTADFPRLRIGIGRADGDTIDHVLSAWSENEEPVIGRVVEAMVEAVVFAVHRGVDAAMNRYNGLDFGPESESEEQDKETLN